jgi:hypothetical protein
MNLALLKAKYLQLLSVSAHHLGWKVVQKNSSHRDPMDWIYGGCVDGPGRWIASILSYISRRD